MTTEIYTRICIWIDLNLLSGSFRFLVRFIVKFRKRSITVWNKSKCWSLRASFIIFWYIIYIFLLVLLIYLNESRPIYKFKQIKKIKVKASVLRRIKFLGDKAQMTRETATCPGTKAADCKSRENLGNKSFIRTIQSVSQSTFVILTSIPLP